LWIQTLTARKLANHSGCRRKSARKIQKFLSQPFFVAQQFTGLEGKYVAIADTIRGFREITEGKHDAIPEQEFYMAGTIDEVIAKAKSRQS